MMGTLTKKTEPHQKCSSSQPPAIGPRMIPMPDTPAQMPMARPRSLGGKMFVMIDSVAGMINAPPDAHQRARGDQHVRRAGERRRDGAEPEDHEPDVEGFLASEPVAEGAHRQEQAGEHQDVGVDHPLQLAGARVQVAREGRQGDVQDGVVHTDDHEAQAERPQGPPPLRVEFRLHPLTSRFPRCRVTQPLRIGYPECTRTESIRNSLVSECVRPDQNASSSDVSTRIGRAAGSKPMLLS